MPKLSKIQSAEYTEEVEVDFGGGEVLHLTVYPSRFTNKRNLLMEQLDEEDEDYYDDFAKLYFAPFVSWDLTDDANNVLPFTGETVEEFSIPTMLKLGKAIGETLNPKSKKTSRRSRGH